MAQPKRPKNFSFVSMDGQIGIYSDIFTVEMEAETGMVALTFYQSGSKFNPADFGAPQQVKNKEVRFLSKIVLSPRGFSVLLKSFLDNAAAVNQAVEAAFESAAKQVAEKKKKS